MGHGGLLRFVVQDSHTSSVKHLALSMHKGFFFFFSHLHTQHGIIINIFFFINLQLAFFFFFYLFRSFLLYLWD